MNHDAAVLSAQAHYYRDVMLLDAAHQRLVAQLPRRSAVRGHILAILRTLALRIAG